MVFEEKNAIKIEATGKNLVYFLLQDEEVVYVGQTTQGLTRPFFHSDKKYNNVRIIECKENQLDVLEDYFIKKYKPAYNKVLNTKMNLTLIRARDEIRELVNPNFDVLQLKKIIKKLNIELLIYNGAVFIERKYMNSIYLETIKEIEK